MTGRIFDIEHGSFVDGPGLRTAVFFKGCHMACAWCHNPESQSSQTQLMVYKDKCIGCGACACHKETCDLCGNCTLRCSVGARRLVGETVNLEYVMGHILEDRPFYGQQGGVTFTGGECMLQPEFLAELLKACRAEQIHTAVDTAGDVPWQRLEAILPDTDLFLYDVKLMDEQLHKKYTGVSNRRILDNLRGLLTHGAKVWIRVPVIPGVNDGAGEQKALEAFLRDLPQPEKVEYLPYHTMGENKYPALGREYQLTVDS